MAAPDLDVEAMDAVVFDFQVSDAGALALAGFQCDQEFAVVTLDGAQFIELSVIAMVNDAAFMKHAGRFRKNGGLQ